MLKVAVLLFQFWATCQVGLSFTNGLLPNGNFELGPKPWQMRSARVIDKKAIPNWEISGFIEYIKSGQKQQDMVLVVPEGEFAVRLGNEASIKQRGIRVAKGMLYSLTFSAARTCAQEQRLNMSVSPSRGDGKSGWGMVPTQTIYGSIGWDSYSWAFTAESNEIDISIHNPGVEEDAACGPLVDSVALKALSPPKRAGANMLKNGNFEEGPFVFPNASWGVLVPPNTDEDRSPIPGWIIESLKAVKYIDSHHFAVPEGKRAVELVAGKESVIAQVVRTRPGEVYALTFAVGDANNACEGSLAVEAFAGNVSRQVPYQSKGRGGFRRAKVLFRAALTRTRVRFMSTVYSMKSDNSGCLCGPVVDDVRLLGVRHPRRQV